MQYGNELFLFFFILIQLIFVVLLHKNSMKLKNKVNYCYEDNLSFMKFAFGDNFIEKTTLQRLQYWNEKYGHDLKIDKNEQINYSLVKMHEYYKKIKK